MRAARRSKECIEWHLRILAHAEDVGMSRTELGHELGLHRNQCYEKKHVPYDEGFKPLYASKMRIINAYKTMKGCVDCGYKDHACALDFDHMPEYKKLFHVTRSMGTPWETLLLEMAKCEVRCANCHRVKTKERKTDSL